MRTPEPPAHPETVLRHFDSQPAFQAWRTEWTPAQQALFCRLAWAVHVAGLDWWHVGHDVQLRFGRKHPDSDRAVGVLGIVQGRRVQTLSWLRPMGPLQSCHKTPLDAALISHIEQALPAARPALDQWLTLHPPTVGLWPDQLCAEPTAWVPELHEEPPSPSASAVTTAAPPARPTRFKPLNRIYYGPPGTGKTRAALLWLQQQGLDDPQHHRFVTFHAAYSYEDFIEGLRPVAAEAVKTNPGTATASACVTPPAGPQYEVRPGVFKTLCEQARRHPHQRFALVIDEINRGPVSQILGDVITLLDPDKREGAAQAAELLLPVSGERFSVPANVDLIATMNTADRSLTRLDTALRRRFEFVPVMPDSRDEPGAPLHGLRVHHGGCVIDIPRLLTALNRRLSLLLDREHTLGHGYFTELHDCPDGAERFAALQHILQHRVLPLLEDCFFDDWHRMASVLGDPQKPPQDRFIVTLTDPDEDWDTWFGRDPALDRYRLRPVYERQDSALSRPTAYTGIYAPALPTTPSQPT